VGKKQMPAPKAGGLYNGNGTDKNWLATCAQ